MKEQGALVDCVYYSFIRPELHGKSNCPVCRGRTPKFKAMRMMDKKTSQNYLLAKIFPKIIEKLAEGEFL